LRGSTQVLVKKIRERLDVFTGFPKIIPSCPMAFPFSHDDHNRRSPKSLSGRSERLGLLQRHNIVGVAVDDQYWGQATRDEVNRRDLSSKLLSTHFGIGKRPKRTHKGRHRSTPHSINAGSTPVQEIGGWEKAPRRLYSAA